jgi:hypothetical protein
MKFLNLPVFIISFAIGLFFVYISSANNKTVVVFPTPENQDKIQYVDNNETCHKYVSEEIQCPGDGTAIDYNVQ